MRINSDGVATLVEEAMGVPLKPLSAALLLEEAAPASASPVAAMLRPASRVAAAVGSPTA